MKELRLEKEQLQGQVKTCSGEGDLRDGDGKSGAKLISSNVCGMEFFFFDKSNHTRWNT